MSRRAIGFALAVASFSGTIASGTIASAQTFEPEFLRMCSRMSREESDRGLYEYMNRRFPGFRGPTQVVMPCWWRYHDGLRLWNCRNYEGNVMCLGGQESAQPAQPDPATEPRSYCYCNERWLWCRNLKRALGCQGELIEQPTGRTLQPAQPADDDDVDDDEKGEEPAPPAQEPAPPARGSAAREREFAVCMSKCASTPCTTDCRKEPMMARGACGLACIAERRECNTECIRRRNE
jgi:hypothetical protein